MAIKIDKEQCIGCESCVATCPTGALSMEDGKANVNEDLPDGRAFHGGRQSKC